MNNTIKSEFDILFESINHKPTIKNVELTFLAASIRNKDEALRFRTLYINYLIRKQNLLFEEATREEVEYIVDSNLWSIFKMSNNPTAILFFRELPYKSVDLIICAIENEDIGEVTREFTETLLRILKTAQKEV